ncbi:hypothetical protein GGF32_008307 [Allomyces javanicus]|nr:hypothetical protein GGF32_008307 [Allomyces javanicus]
MATFASNALPSLVVLTISSTNWTNPRWTIPVAAERLRRVKAQSIHPAVVMALQQRRSLKELSTRVLDTAGRNGLVHQLTLEYAPDNVIWRALARMWLVDCVSDRLIVRVVRTDSTKAAAYDVRNMVFRLAGLDTGSTGIRDTDGDEEDDEGEMKWFRRVFGGCDRSSEREDESEEKRDRTPAKPLVVGMKVGANVSDAEGVAERIWFSALNPAYVVVGHVGVEASGEPTKRIKRG